MFTLRTRADRIEQLRDGRYAILDYKTGSTPTEKQVRTGLSPQLTLEGAILRAGRLPGYRRRIDQPRSPMWRCAAASRRANSEPIEFKDGDARRACRPGARAARKHRRRASRIEATPYRSLVSPMWKTRYGDYDHLARIKEWSAGGEEEEME